MYNDITGVRPVKISFINSANFHRKNKSRTGSALSAGYSERVTAQHPAGFLPGLTGQSKRVDVNASGTEKKGGELIKF